MTTQNKPGVFAGRTAEQWEALASQSARASAESWERSDTDGFLSQWASDQMVMRYRDLAELARNGGFVYVNTLQDLETGAIARMEWQKSKFYGGADWVRMPDGRYINESTARSLVVRLRNYAKKGVRPVTVRVPALLNHKTYYPYPDRDAEWVVDEEATTAWEKRLDEIYAGR